MSWETPEQAALQARLVLPLVDILIANPEEICLVTETEEPEEAIDRLQQWGVPLVVAKLGSEGTRAIGSQQSLFLPSYPVEVLSTIGAGDGISFRISLCPGQRDASWRSPQVWERRSRHGCQPVDVL